MLLPEKRLHGILLRRYKRFLADIRLENGNTLTVHCPNSGSMAGCSAPGSEVIISDSRNPKRKYQWTLEMVRENKTWVGVNTSMTNKLVMEALTSGAIRDFGKIHSITPEVKVSDRSRLDFCLETEVGSAYLEVKNCSLVENGVAMFPDAVTARGTKHLIELLHLAEQGHRAAIVFCIQRSDCSTFKPAASIDPEYTSTFLKVTSQGVQAYAYQAEVTPEQITISKKLPIVAAT